MKLALLHLLGFNRILITYSSRRGKQQTTFSFITNETRKEKSSMRRRGATQQDNIGYNRRSNFAAWWHLTKGIITKHLQLVDNYDQQVTQTNGSFC
jgi:hypothetical protein